MQQKKTKRMCVGVYMVHVCARAKSLQSCPTVSDAMDCSPPASSVHGILQARILKGIACPLLGDLPDPGIKPTFHFVFCTGRQILYH